MTEGHFDNHFDTQKILDKYDLDDTTFDMINIIDFRNFKFSTIFWYLWNWVFMFLSLVLIGIDVYTCLNILVFKKWGETDDYKPYAYIYAKWIFTGCIIFQFLLLFYHWIWAIKAFRSKNIAYVFVNPIAKLLYIIISFDYFCLFNDIDPDNFFDSSCFLILDQLDCALQILVADAPRQVINILTLKYYATNGDSSYDILNNIKNLYTYNQKLSIILSFILLSLIIWSIFFFKFLFAMLLYLPIYCKLRSKKGYKSFKKYCCTLVNNIVRVHIANKKHLKREQIDLRYMERKASNFNLLHNSSTQDFAYEPNKKGVYEMKNFSNDTIRSYDDFTNRGNLSKDAFRNGSLSSLTEARKNTSFNSYDNGGTSLLSRYDSDLEMMKANTSSKKVTNPFISRFDSFDSSKTSNSNYQNTQNPFMSSKPYKSLQKSSTFDLEYSMRSASSSNHNFTSNRPQDPIISYPRINGQSSLNKKVDSQNVSNITNTSRGPTPDRSYNKSTIIGPGSNYNSDFKYENLENNESYINDEHSIDLTDSKDPFVNSLTELSNRAMKLTEELIPSQEKLPYPTRGISMLDDNYDYEHMKNQHY